MRQKQKSSVEDQEGTINYGLRASVCWFLWIGLLTRPVEIQAEFWIVHAVLIILALGYTYEGWALSKKRKEHLKAKEVRNVEPARQKPIARAVKENEEFKRGEHIRKKVTKKKPVKKKAAKKTAAKKKATENKRNPLITEVEIYEPDGECRGIMREMWNENIPEDVKREPTRVEEYLETQIIDIVEDYSDWRGWVVDNGPDWIRLHPRDAKVDGVFYVPPEILKLMDPGQSNTPFHIHATKIELGRTHYVGNYYPYDRGDNPKHDEYSKLILKVKDGDQTACNMLADVVRHFFSNPQGHDTPSTHWTVLSMPSHDPKKTMTGIRRIARSLKCSNISDGTESLRRISWTKPLSKGGERNVASQIQSLGLFDRRVIKNKHVLLLDDVITSGTTMAAAREVIESGEPLSVTSIALGKTTRGRQLDGNPNWYNPFPKLDDQTPRMDDTPF